ncbi:uncharacterized protein LOC144039789 isoform X2 [Vanacampus margaritifer]
MFRRSKSQVLVEDDDDADDASWRRRHSHKEAKVKTKARSKTDRKDNKMFSSKDDERFLLTGETLPEHSGRHKKAKWQKDGKTAKSDKALCFWESVTMTMRHKKTEGWETPQARKDDISVPEEDAVQNGHRPRPPPADWSRHANLPHSEYPAGAVTWTSRAKVKLAGISRMSRRVRSDGSWEGLK